MLIVVYWGAIASAIFGRGGLTAAGERVEPRRHDGHDELGVIETQSLERVVEEDWNWWAWILNTRLGKPAETHGVEYLSCESYAKQHWLRLLSLYP